MWGRGPSHWSALLIASIGLIGIFGCRPSSEEMDRLSSRPNFVVLFADDLGYGDLGCFGADRIRTPHIDRLAGEGIRLTAFYTCEPVCTPSRAGLLTGRYPVRSGLTRVLWPTSTTGIEDGEITLAEALRDQGYATACIGKWHLGHLPPFLPTRHGFDLFFGIPYSTNMTPTPLMRHEEVIEVPAPLATLPERYAKEAVAFIREHRDEPFFLYLPHTLPHIPLAVPGGMAGRSEQGPYGDAVESIDRLVGEIMDTLKELGLDRDTLFIVTSDNGPDVELGDRGGSTGPLKKGKKSIFEGGIRVPFVARWPARIPGGTTSGEPAITLDLLPTLLRQAGGTLPSDRPIDGEDIISLLTGAGMSGDRVLYFSRFGKLRALRQGRWKLHGRFTGQQFAHEPKLFDLLADPGEERNVAGEHPGIIEELQTRLEEFEEEVGRDAPPAKL